jgi:hypothetical protein
VAVVQRKGKWHVVLQDLIHFTTTLVAGEDYDDESTAKLAGILFAKMKGLSFLHLDLTHPSQGKELAS